MIKRNLKVSKIFNIENITNEVYENEVFYIIKECLKTFKKPIGMIIVFCECIYSFIILEIMSLN